MLYGWGWEDDWDGTAIRAQNDHGVRRSIERIFRRDEHSSDGIRVLDTYKPQTPIHPQQTTTETTGLQTTTTTETAGLQTTTTTETAGLQTTRQRQWRG